MKMENYVVYYTHRHVSNVQYVLIQAERFAGKYEILDMAKDAVKSVCHRSDNITAITCSDGAWVHVGNGEFQYYGD